MQESLINAIRFRRTQIHARWADLLRADRANTPLGNPDALVHLLDWTLDEIFGALSKPGTRRRHSRHAAATADTPHCPCGRNPLLRYFTVGEQALQEALILAQASLTSLDPLERDASMQELILVLRHIARHEIEAFCGVCVHREGPGCDSAAAIETAAPAPAPQ
jgi:hypothetical protein